MHYSHGETFILTGIESKPSYSLWVWPNLKLVVLFYFRETGNAKLCEDYEMLTRMVDSEENFLEVIWKVFTILKHFEQMSWLTGESLGRGLGLESHQAVDGDGRPWLEQLPVAGGRQRSVKVLSAHFLQTCLCRNLQVEELLQTAGHLPCPLCHGLNLSTLWKGKQSAKTSTNNFSFVFIFLKFINKIKCTIL